VLREAIPAESRDNDKIDNVDCGFTHSFSFWTFLV